ncbi:MULTISPECIES: hypothetical protein [Paracoccus]|uniref:Uncharacterized protein n=1 Tax=Paracoccus yeei TaxID=147645 RepID=A0A386UUE9_9RHOB|nr:MULTISPECIES: hypothetical protein [Paracoccus]AYF03810.1 hypothetical protein PY32053_04283 [Paracoccus yeei]QEU06528.1 hypothetical protein FOB51_00155 [Paracoccus yeei]QIR86672.1 hypothetical protein FIU66_15355 [Paracoccus sp. AK26]
MSAEAGSLRLSLQDWLRKAATAILMVAFAVLILQTTAHAGMGAHIRHDHLAMAAADHHCQPSDAAAGEFGLSSSDHCGADADRLDAYGDNCDQLCTLSIVLPRQTLTDPFVGGDFLFKIWSDPLGRTALGPLRPPRSFVAA